MSGIHNNKVRNSNWGRPTTTKHRLNAGAEITLADCVYDGLGRLTRDRRNGVNPLDTRYSYNVRNWLTELGVGFNASTNTLGTNYLQDLYYNEGRTSGATPQWAGNISGMSWKAGGESVLHAYDFTYDGLSRLTGATSSPTGGQTRAYTYDNHGNVQSVTGGGASQSFSYTGNQLSSDQHGGATTLHTYDGNGRLSTSGGWSYYYNAVGLPSVQASSGGVTRWVYAADGTKLSRETLNGTGPRMDYVSNLVYKDSTLNRILVEGGYIDMTGSTPAYRFYVTDHQGNVRLVTEATGTPLQVNHYDPFGNELDMTASTSPVGGSAVISGTATVNPYKYSGKEWDDQASLYDFSARMYNPTIARFTAMDPLCEKYYGISPYVYCKNNPVNRIDSNGLVDKEWLKKGGSTLGAGLVATIGGGLAISSGVGVAPGAFALSTGIPAIGLGVGMIIEGLITDPTPEGRRNLESMPTGVLNSIGRAADQALETENHPAERVADFVDAVIGLGTLSKPKSVMEAVINGATIAQAGIAADKLNDLAEQRESPSPLPSKTDRVDNTDWQENLYQYSLWKPLEYQYLNTGAYWQ